MDDERGDEGEDASEESAEDAEESEALEDLTADELPDELPEEEEAWSAALSLKKLHRAAMASAKERKEYFMICKKCSKPRGPMSYEAFYPNGKVLSRPARYGFICENLNPDDVERSDPEYVDCSTSLYRLHGGRCPAEEFLKWATSLVVAHP